MKINIKNNTRCDFDLICNEKSTYLQRKSNVSVNLRGEKSSITLKSRGKSTVHLNWIDIILGVFFGDGTFTQIYCTYTFEISNPKSDVILIDIKDNDWNAREQISFYAPYALSNDADIDDVNYQMQDFDRIKRKHKRLHLLVTPVLPIGIALIVCMFFFTPILPFLLGFLVWLFIFPVPSFKEIKRFNSLTQPNNVSNTLISYAKEHRNGGNDYNKDTSKTSKLINKVLDKMFKLDEDKK